MEKINWYEITKKYGNVPYKKGSWDIKEGLDEFSLFILFLGELGYDVLKYKDEYNYSGPKLLEFIRTRFKKIQSLKKGCICIIDAGEYPKYPMIYLGRNLFLVAQKDIGCRIIKHPVNNIKEIYI